MRRLFSSLAISADGYYADTERGLAWQAFGPEFADLSVELLDEVDTLVLGRITYEEMVTYWTGDVGTTFDPRIAERMNRRAKLVASRTLETVSWLDSPIGLTTVDGIAAFKRTPGGDAVVLGSATLAGALLRAGLIDELRLIVNPVILGDGLRPFPATGTVPLELVRTRSLTSGAVVLHYRPATPI